MHARVSRKIQRHNPRVAAHGHLRDIAPRLRSRGADAGAHARSWARFEGGELVLLAFRPPVPGDPRVLARQTNDPRVKGAVQSDVPIVVASKTSDSIASASNLAIVPYGDGEIVLRRQAGSKAEIISHYFRGAPTRNQATIENGQLKLTARERNSSGRTAGMD